MGKLVLHPDISELEKGGDSPHILSEVVDQNLFFIFRE
jgi:hypothetical protein